jgi:hypothetical protein
MDNAMKLYQRSMILITIALTSANTVAAQRQFKKGTILQSDVGRGGSDEVVINGKDKQGKPWMRVRSVAGETYNCNVRANSRYIQPYTGK